MKKSVDGLVDRGQISRGLIAPSCSDGRKNGSVSGPSSSCRNYFLQTNALVIFLRISATWLIIPFSLSNRLIALSTCLHSFRVCLFTLFFSSFLIVFFLYRLFTLEDLFMFGIYLHSYLFICELYTARWNHRYTYTGSKLSEGLNIFVYKLAVLTIHFAISLAL